ncbi:MAG: TraR/DksA family transcriptional regulator [Nitrososphaerota archaeon]
MPKNTENINQSFIAKIREKLTRQKELLESEISKLKADDPFFQEDRPITPSEPGKMAMEYEGHERIEVVRNDLKKALNQVKKALSAIVNRKYGKCERCGAKIDKARLEIVPETTLCLSCEQKIEKLSSKS